MAEKILLTAAAVVAFVVRPFMPRRGIMTDETGAACGVYTYTPAEVHTRRKVLAAFVAGMIVKGLVG